MKYIISEETNSLLKINNNGYFFAGRPITPEEFSRAKEMGFDDSTRIRVEYECEGVINGFYFPCLLLDASKLREFMEVVDIKKEYNNFLLDTKYITDFLIREEIICAE